jgi:tetratricopeptide (TPR) repeat protein
VQVLRETAAVAVPPELIGTPTSSVGDADAARFHLFDDVVGHLREVARATPVLVVLEDIHWADRPSLLLLAFATRELRTERVLLVATYRDDEVGVSHPVAEVLGDLVLTARRLPLAGLDLDAVAALIRAETGEADDALTAAVHRRTGGNPLFVGETVRLLGAEGRLGDGARWDLVIPQGAREAIGRRVARLSQDCHSLLSVASVIGPEFPVDVLAAVADLDPSAALDLLDEAAASGLVRTGGAIDRWSFSHALVADAIASDLRGRRRAELHGAIAASVERLRAARLEEHVAEIAHHALEALPVGDVGRAFRFSVRAGRRALGHLAYEDAALHFQRALHISPAAGTDDERAELLLALGDAQLRAGDRLGARKTFEDAAEQARVRGRPDGLARAALAFGAGLSGFEVAMFDQVQIDLLEEALSALPADDTALRAWVLARLSVALSFVASGERCRALAEEAVAVARRVGDQAAVAYALAAFCDAISGPSHTEARSAAASEIVELAQAAGERQAELLGRRLRVLAHLERGDRAAFEGEVDAYARVADALGQPLYSWYVPLWRGTSALLDGRLDEVPALTAAAASEGAKANSSNAALLTWVQDYMLALQQGRMGEMLDSVDDMIRSHPELAGNPSATVVNTGMHALGGRIQTTFAELDRILRDGVLDNVAQDAEWLPAISVLARAAVIVGHRAASAVLYERLAPYAGRWAVEGIAAGVHGAIDRDLGLLSATLGDTDAAVRHLTAARAAHQAAGAAALVALVDADLADLGRAPSLSDPSAAAAVFRQEGETWTVSYAGTTARLRDAMGLHDLAALLRVPGREIHVTDLMGGPATATGRAGADPDLDDRARAAYRARVEELQGELDDAEAAHDLGRIERARAELDFVLAELSGALGLGGRSRRSADPGERARKAVTNRIANALDRVERAHPEAGRHLRRAVRTGSFCSYDPEQPVDWAL